MRLTLARHAAAVVMVIPAGGVASLIVGREIAVRGTARAEETGLAYGDRDRAQVVPLCVHKAEIIPGFGNGSYQLEAVVTRLEMLGGFRIIATISA